MDNTIKNKYLNSFTILSYNPNNIYVSFKSETLFLDETKWENEDSSFSQSQSQSQSNIENENDNNQIDEEYWIINEDGKNKITYRKYC